jgi:hypothetical protein
MASVLCVDEAVFHNTELNKLDMPIVDISWINNVK